MLKTNTRIKQTNNVILIKIRNNSILLIFYFYCIINFKINIQTTR